MLEIHNLPTAEKYEAEFISGVVNDYIYLAMYDKEARLETGTLGIKRYVQISTSQLEGKPKTTDQLVIEDTKYKILTVSKRNTQPFRQFWECEIKTIK